MQPELPAPDPEGVAVPDASHPRVPAQRFRRRPLRVLHLMALVAAVALTLIIAPSLLKAITQPGSGWGRDERLFYQISLS